MLTLAVNGIIPLVLYTIFDESVWWIEIARQFSASVNVSSCSIIQKTEYSWLWTQYDWLYTWKTDNGNFDKNSYYAHSSN